MEKLTENNIKHATLSFLKSYYRFRPRSGDTEASIDMRGKGGIIADGFLSFPQEDGQPFLATFEATSNLSRDEIVYKVQKDILFWDSVAVACMGTAAWFIYSYIENIYTVKEVGVWTTVGVNWLFMLGLYFLYRILFSRLRRYRYIYAVEQFKRYHADEQWVAIGEDIFNDAENKYLEELRKQCIRNGFGLIIVDKYKVPQLSITPSRNELFENKRKMIQFFNLEDLSKRLNETNYSSTWKKLQDQIAKLFGAAQANSLDRFRKDFYGQMFLSGISLALIFGILYREMKDPLIVYADEEKYEEEIIANQSATKKKETSSYLLDTLALRKFEKNSKPYLEFERYVPPRQNEEEARPTEVVFYNKGKISATYACERFYNFEKQKYIIAYQQYPDLEAASRSIAELDKIGVEAHCFWLGCFFQRENDYLVYLNVWYNSRWEARADSRDFEAFLEKKNKMKELDIRTIYPISDEE